LDFIAVCIIYEVHERLPGTGPDILKASSVISDVVRTQVTTLT
jgi:hypothetical protein